MISYIWKNLSDGERKRFVDLFHDGDGVASVGTEFEAEMLEEFVPFTLDTVEYNGSLRLVVIMDGPDSADNSQHERARMACCPVIMPDDITVQVSAEAVAVMSS